jgi:hypothetical protein
LISIPSGHSHTMDLEYHFTTEIGLWRPLCVSLHAAFPFPQWCSARKDQTFAVPLDLVLKFDDGGCQHLSRFHIRVPEISPAFDGRSAITHWISVSDNTW